MKQRYRNIVFLPTKLILQANDEGWSRSLGYLVRMKGLFKNNTVYHFSLRRLAQLLKCSPTCLSHHLRELEIRGLIRRHAGNMTFTGLRKLLVMTGSKNTMAVRVDDKKQFDLVRSLIIKNNLQRQAYKMRRSGINLRKNAGAIVPANFTERANSSYIGLSCKGIGGLLGLSVNSGASGSRIRKKLEGMGVIKSERKFSILRSHSTYTDFIQLKSLFLIPQYSFLMTKGPHKGSIMVERRRAIEYIGYGDVS